MSENTSLIPRANQYGRPSFFEKVSIFFKLLLLPIVLVWTFVFKWSGRTRKRSVCDGRIRYVVTKFNIRQLQYLFGTTRGNYTTWCKQAKQEPQIESIGGDANLLWIGERRPEKVILYLHGGGFLLPPGVTNIAFFAHVVTKLRERGINASVAMLEYTLVPVAAFPTQLKQAVAAINHLMSLGVDPQDIQLAGDSAGANLILQVLAHLLHPLEYENVPPLSLPSPLKGACLISPWVDLSDIHGTLSSGNSTDMLTAGIIRDWGSQVLGPVPREYLGYIEANSAKDDWWKGVDAFADRVLVTAGREECLNNEIIRFKSVFETFHSHVNMQEHSGIHNDPFYAWELGESGGGAPDMIVDWLQAGFQEAAV
ncbi:hypothetical protein AGABI1DRAFT_102467 [Agaricus bisporus var. burnettii JB137-S8]|uniref:Alpha/beta hydrolase fold-3 domain-containing protein n=1 Tax=Agaricus bisporus var. burnettii (strain JB137-S8 / ATCC MYA-4627 / FGSC 10392) TaxID=597362 RepID=K5XNF9_AGABU|nr:uncharacterized protein AGABI1DRAFT_102467 [Agaricus bisporus var. burnettii JB137-S8]EKM76170.1 hypothetical protein AGABI1DRAFT_102467 [Agaricus bisporus var. burnettii JB137-S8]